MASPRYDSPKPRFASNDGEASPTRIAPFVFYDSPSHSPTFPTRPPPKLVPTFQISRPLHATSPTPSLSDDGLVLVDGGGDLLYSESPPTVEFACDYVGNKNNNSRKSSRQEVRKTESQHPLKLLDRGASFMDHTFSSKMQRVDALCDDELGEADWADAPEIPEDPEFLGAQQAKAKPTKKKKEAPTSPDDVEEQFVIKPLETVEDYRKGKKPKDPYPLPSSSPQLSDSELLSEVSTKATAFLSAAKQHPLSPGASQPPLPSEMWDLIKEGYEAKIAKVRRQERRRGRSDERKKIMEKSLIERLNESEVRTDKMPGIIREYDVASCTLIHPSL